MKNLNKIGLLLLIVSSIAIGGTVAVGSQFSYQGQLKDNGAPANGLYDMRFRIYSGLTGGAELGTMDIDDVEVTNGLFSVALDFGDALFDGKELYLEILVTVANFPGYFLLTPRQRINAVPYAIQSEFVENGSSPWLNAFSGVQYNGDVVVGNLVADAGDTLQVVSDPGDSPLRVIVDTVGTRFRVSKNGGTGIGSNYSDAQIPDNGLRVNGDTILNGNLIQGLGKHGAIKAATVIQCGAGINGVSERFFNNINGNDFTTTQDGAGGFCTITAPFDLSDAYWVVSANNATLFTSYNASCQLKSGTTTELLCQISMLSNTVTNANGTLQLLFY